MALAHMVALDEDALMCDFAQYYRMTDYKEAGLRKAAVLACGLPAESRIMKKLNGQKADQDTICRIAILDTVRSIEYAYYKTHSKGEVRKPEPILEKMLGTRNDGNIETFDSPEEFEKALAELEED